MSIIGIVAVGSNGAIGKGGTIPWRSPADLKFFKEQTLGHACVMGRRTWLSLKKPLPERLNIVLSSSLTGETPEGVIVLPDKRAALSLAPYLSGHLFIIGGEQVYKAFQPEIESWMVTEIPLAVADADTFMPKNYLQGFSPSDSRRLADDLKVTFYKRDVPARRRINQA
ncbi:MAG: dihydrofolate reductase [Pyrinomonadaceae bacterium]